MKVVITGATGFIGTEVLHQALLHPSITTVIALSRRALNPPIKHPKLRVVILEDFSTYPPAVLTELEGTEACIWTLGIKTSSVPDQRLVCLTYTRAIMEALTQLPNPPKNPIRFVFTSGQLAIRDPSACALFLGPARKVKGEAETELLEFAARDENRERIEAVVTRPGWVHGPGMTLSRAAMAALPGELKGVGVQELAAVSLDVAIKGEDAGKFLENSELATRGAQLLKASMVEEK